MGLPTLDIVFKTAADNTIRASKKGTVAVIVKDGSAKAGGYVLFKASDAPGKLNQGNLGYVQRAFWGYVSAPTKVLLYVLPSAAEDLTQALAWLSTWQFDYLAAPPDATTANSAEVVAWIKTMRTTNNATYKAVLPNTAADNEAMINFTASGIRVGDNTYTAGQYCSRIAGLLAGTPMTISSTYAPLPEVSDIDRLDKAATDAAIDAGQFVLYYDGVKVKAGRGVTSLTTVTEATGKGCKKIKIVEIRDLVSGDLHRAIEDSYIGKYSNSYDDKCLLITYIREYLSKLESEGLLKAGVSTVEIDMDAQRSYLKDAGVDVDALSEQEIREANTGTNVFLVITINILDAMEDVRVVINL